jgi:hypothetical protein
MIVIVGSPIAQPGAERISAAGLAADVARAAAAAGAAVQVVGRVGEDAAGDQVLLDLAAAGVGHVAVLREPGRPTPGITDGSVADGGLANGSASPVEPVLGEAMLEDLDLDDGAAGGARADGSPAGLSVDAGDLDLALRYVPDYRVLVLAADLDPAALEAVVAAAGWSGAHLIALVADGAPTHVLPDGATVLLRPAADPDRAFATMVAGYAVALDRGDEPRAAFASVQRAGGWAAVAD